MNQTIILLDESAAEAYKLLVELSGEGMLHEALTVLPDREAWYLDDGDVSKVELGEHLAGRAIQLARVIHLSLSGRPISESHLETVDRLKKTLIPVGVKLELASLVVPLAGVKVDAGAFPQYWNYNLLVEPSDMAGEAGFAFVPLTSSAKQLAIATAAVVMCGGLWKWLDSGPLDSGRFRADSGKDAANYDAQIHGARVRLIRVTTRMVDAGNIASQAVSSAFAAGAKFPPPHGCIPHGDDHQAVTELASAIAPVEGDSHFGFTYRPYVPPPPPHRRTLSPFKAILSFLKEFWEHVRRLPLEMVLRQWTKVKRTVEEKVTNGTYGADSDIRVSFDKAAPLEIAIDLTQRADAVSSLAELRLAAPPPTPSTWSDLMTVVLGAADGGDFPTDCGIDPPQWANQRAVIVNVGAIAHASVADPTGSQFRILKSEAEKLGWTMEEDLLIPASHSAAVEVVRSRIQSLEHPEQSNIGEETQDSGEKAAKKKTDQTIPKEMKALSDRLTKWVDQQSSTLVWKVADSINRHQNRALDDLERTSADLGEILEQMNQVEAEELTSRKRFGRRAIVILLCLVALILGVTYGILFVAAISMIVWVIALVVGLLGIMWAMVKTAAQRVRDAHRRDDIASRPQQLIQRRQVAAQEYIRLASLYRQYQDWAQIAAIALHRPLGNVHQNVIQPWETRVGALSFVCGKPRFNSERIQATTFKVMQQIATQGWLTRAYQEQRGLIVEAYERIAGEIAATDTLPEADVATNLVIARQPGVHGMGEIVVYAPRTHLLHSFKSETWSGLYRDQLISTLNKAGANADSFNMIETVECDVVGLNDPPRGPREFLTPIVEWQVIPSFSSLLSRHRVVEGVPCGSIVGISNGLDAKIPSGQRTVIPVLQLENRFTLAAFRLDISDALDLQDVELISSQSNALPQTSRTDHEDSDGIIRYG